MTEPAKKAPAKKEGTHDEAVKKEGTSTKDGPSAPPTQTKKEEAAEKEAMRKPAQEKAEHNPAEAKIQQRIAKDTSELYDIEEGTKLSEPGSAVAPKPGKVDKEKSEELGGTEVGDHEETVAIEHKRIEDQYSRIVSTFDVDEEELPEDNTEAVRENKADEMVRLQKTYTYGDQG